MNPLSRFVFFGNGPVAAESLVKICEHLGKDCIELIITKRRPTHHKEEAPLDKVAHNLNLKIEYADNKKELTNLINKIKPESKVGLVIDFGVIISKETINYFSFGILNSHFSLLPHWRGADPITYSILSGQEKTGISLILIDSGLDTGALLAVTELDLDGSETGLSLSKILVESSAMLISEILPLYVSGSVTPYKQQSSVITYSKKLNKNNGQLIWEKTATELEREVRAFSQWPKSYFSVAGMDIVVLESQATDNNLKIGQLSVSSKNTLEIGCKTGSLKILKVKPAGKKEMPIEAFLNGYGKKLTTPPDHR